MKTLYIIRHAKSSWSFNQLDDFNRPLGQRGRGDVVKTGKYLAANHPTPGQIITSSASRAFYTALFYADAWKFPEDSIEVEPQFYHADEEEMMEVIRYDGKSDVLAVVGHNPGMTDMANTLTGSFIENIPTGAVFAIDFDIESWEDLSTGSGKQKFFVKPREV